MVNILIVGLCHGRKRALKPIERRVQCTWPSKPDMRQQIKFVMFYEATEANRCYTDRCLDIVFQNNAIVDTSTLSIRLRPTSCSHATRKARLTKRGSRQLLLLSARTCPRYALPKKAHRHFTSSLTMPPTRSAAYGGSDASSAAPRLNLPPHQSSARSVTATVASTTSSSSRAREMLHAASTTAAGRRSTPRTRPEDDVLADSSSSSSASSSSLPATRLPRGARQQLQQQQQRNHLQQAPTRRIRRLSPDRSGGLGAGRPAGRSHAGANARSGKSTTATSQSAGAAAANEELEFVNRQPDGNFLLGLGGPMGGAMAAFGGGNMTNLWKAAQHSDGQEDDGDVEGE